MKHSQFTVQGVPFFSLGGQTYNSTSYVLADMPLAFESVRKLGGNTVATPICWHAFEPTEGKFNTKYVTDIIDLARIEKMHLIFLWFGSWKNGNMEYTPNWVKCDRARFQRSMCRDGSELGVLSCHSTVNQEADKKAFIAFMRLLKEYDGDTQTVIAVQVENEPGIVGPTKRDFSPLGQKDYESNVPQVLLDYIAAHPESKLAGFHRKAGSAPQGTWAEVFGDFGAEACEANALCRYINGIAKAGKEVYDLFLYINVWLDGGSKPMGWDLAGVDYPAGGAVSKVLDIWYAQADALDAICPDNYKNFASMHRDVTDLYSTKTKEGWPLYVPESHAAALNASEMFYAIVDKGAIGYHIFATEGVLGPDGEVHDRAKPMMHSMHMLSAIMPVLPQACQAGKAISIVQELGALGQLFRYDGWKIRVSYNGPGFGWGAKDRRHYKPEFQEGVHTFENDGEKGRGILLIGEDGYYYLVGHLIRLFFERPEPADGHYPISLISVEHQASNMSVLDLTEGHFDEEGRYVVDHVRNGDEKHGIWAMWDCGVIRFKMEG